MQNRSTKTTYSRNETMLKIGHLAKAMAFAWAIAFLKYSTLAKKFHKTCQNRVCTSSWSNSVQKPLEKTPNIPEMRRC